MRERSLTKAQRLVLEHVAANPGRLYGSGHRWFPRTVLRNRAVLERVWFAGLISPPVQNEPRTWEITPAGRAALQDPKP